MKFLYLFGLVLLSHVTSSQANNLELTSKNLTYLALKQASAEEITAYAKHLAMSKHSKTFFKYIKNKQKRQELITQVENQLKAELKILPKQAEFNYGKKISLDYTGKESHYSVNDFTKGVVTSFFRDNTGIKGLPDYFYLLFSNIEILENVELNKNNLQELTKNNKSKNLKQAYVEANLILTEYQNKQDFQVVIKSFSIYADKSKKLLLANKIEKRNLASITENWFLAGGFTNNLVGIHAFSVFGHRVQDQIASLKPLQKICEKASKLGVHQVLVCQQPYSENTQLITTYIGGKIAQLDLVATKIPNASEKKKIITQISAPLKRPKAFFNKKQSWEQHLTQFDYNPAAFDATPIQVLPYKHQYKTKLKSTIGKGLLIFTMIGKATQNLIEESK